MGKAPPVDPSQIVAPQKQRQLSYYVFLCAVIVPLCCSVPLSWVYVIYVLRSGLVWHLSWTTLFWFSAALCEVFFSAWHFQMAQFVVASRPNLRAGNLALPQNTFGRVLQAGMAPLLEAGYDLENGQEAYPGSPGEDIVRLRYDDPRAVDFRNYTRTWFGGVAWNQIHQHELWRWIYWMTFNLPLPPYDAIPAAHRAVLTQTQTLIEMRAGARFPRGSDPRVKPMLLNLDRANCSAYRPFAWYAGVALGDWAVRRVYAWKYDTHYGRRGDFEYLLRLPKKWNKATGERPVVFWHGLGLGVLMYKGFITNILDKFPDRPVLVPLQPHISQQVFHPRFLEPLTPRETADALAGVLAELGWVGKGGEGEGEGSDSGIEMDGAEGAERGVTMVSHSNGTYAHAWMLKAHPHLVARSCFIDPVTFCVWEGDVCNNFLYRSCLTGMALLMRYLIATELGTANTLQRHFDWASNGLFYEQIPAPRDARRTLYVVAGKDGILNARRVQRYLTSHGVREGKGEALHFDERARHGDALQPGHRCCKRVVEWLREQ
ncbi:hypothetical protein HWV62_15154 [Athelia sp. TMB]|nr:hypothetical protein HWV62_15154 [Athelia sp. TMB]